MDIHFVVDTEKKISEKKFEMFKAHIERIALGNIHDMITELTDDCKFGKTNFRTTTLTKLEREN